MSLQARSAVRSLLEKRLSAVVAKEFADSDLDLLLRGRFNSSAKFDGATYMMFKDTGLAPGLCACLVEGMCDWQQFCNELLCTSLIGLLTPQLEQPVFQGRPRPGLCLCIRHIHVPQTSSCHMAACA